MSSSDASPAKAVAKALSALEKDADELCARDPLAARTRLLLLKLEKQGHRLGWDHPDNIGMVFQTQYNPRTSHVEHRWSDKFTDIIKMITQRNGGHVGLAFQDLASVCEGVLKGEFDYRLPPEFRNISWAQPGADIREGDRPGWKFYGYGYRYEAWLVEDDEQDDTRRMWDENRLGDHRNRVEARHVCLAARDGRLWCVSRVRGEDPTIYVEPGDGTRNGMGGNAINGLGRLTNAMVGDSVPIRPRKQADPRP